MSTPTHQSTPENKKLLDAGVPQHAIDNAVANGLNLGGFLKLIPVIMSQWPQILSILGSLGFNPGAGGVPASTIKP